MIELMNEIMNEGLGYGPIYHAKKAQNWCLHALFKVRFTKFGVEIHVIDPGGDRCPRRRFPFKNHFLAYPEMKKT